jgi:hypothetical protein
MLSENPRSFSEMLEGSGVSSSHLAYHLENLGQLVSKTDDGKYRLSTFGETAVVTMSRIEETPKEPKYLSSLPLKWKSLFVTLLIGLVALAGISYTQYQSLNKISVEHGQLSAQWSTLVSPSVAILNSTFPNVTFISPNPVTTLLNPDPFPNGTIIQRGIMMTCWGSIICSNGTAVAYGPLVIPCHLEELANRALIVVPDYDLQSLIANCTRASPS